MDPSHRITFIPADGTPPHVLLVRMVCATFPRRMWHDAKAVTIGECWTWHHPEGLVDNQNGWNCSGLPTPGYVPGEVVVEPLRKGWEPTYGWTSPDSNEPRLSILGHVTAETRGMY